MIGRGADGSTRKWHAAPRRPGRVASSLLGVLMLIAGPALACEKQVSEGYHLTDFAAPPPCDFSDGAVIDAPDLKALIEAGGRPVLIDVTPIPKARQATINGYWVVHNTHENIADSVWLPNVGYGVLDEPMQGYFRTNLDKATAGDRSRLLVLYGATGGWMSWNAANRAHDLGYERVAWLSGGMEGWLRHGEPAALAVPEPLFRSKRIEHAALNR